jgi:MYXO-CTERM domain-containing protein
MHRSKRVLLRVVSGLAVLSMAGVALTPNAAEACGGTFCDGGVPGPMPVDQSGENVIFVVGDTESEVHIQITIDPNTNAENFGWLVPLTAVPEFSVGSQPLFDQIRAASVPQYDITTTFENCGGNVSSGGSDPSGGDPNDSAGGTGLGDEGGSSGEGPTVLLEEAVGAFQVAVLQDTEVGPIKKWLEDNGYLWDAKAEPILMEYLAEGNVIAALKLRRSTTINDVHPITLRYPSSETCFPLRLTRIAAVEDMDIRVFVLAENRAAPTNYKHVLVNPLKIDWLNRATNYKEVITQAVDAFMADGRAFVTEFAGASSAVNTAAVYSPTWDENDFIGLDPVQVVQTLNQQGLGACFESFDCAWNHPLVYGLLLEFLPPPMGVDPAEFYAYLGNYAADIDVSKWDMGKGFAAGMLERVIEPGMHGEELIKTWPYLTRMYTTISPNEMMEDPIFHVNASLPDVPALRTAQNYVLCNGDSVVTLPGGDEFYLPGGGPWPAIPGEEWWAAEVQTVAIKGAPMTIVNNTAAISKKRVEWNLSHGWPHVPSDTGVPTEGGSGSESSGSEGSASGSDSSGADGEGGCGCRSDEGMNGALGLGFAAFGALALRRRRR